MPNFNARIRTHVDADGKANIKIRVTHKGETRYIPTKYYIEPEYFDSKAGRVKPSHPLAADTNIELGALELTYSRKILKLEGRINDISISDLLTFVNDTDKMGLLDFFAIAKKKLAELKQQEKGGSALILENTINKVEAYSGRQVLPFVSITQTWLKGFEAWYKKTGTQNSAAIHLRNIRTIYNIALDDYALSAEYYPFRRFKIKTQATAHRDITVVEVARLARYESKVPFENTARDLWLLSFYLLGMNFKDLILLKSSDMKRGRITYHRAKTGTLFNIKVEPEAQEIINRYRGKKYLLKFIEHKMEVQEKKDRTTPLHKDITDRTNRKLKDIIKDADIDAQLSTYYARHSWGSIAASVGVSYDIIREALGHSRTVTDVYINFYVEQIDKANRLVLDAVKACPLDE